jgi:hypothetical protein
LHILALRRWVGTLLISPFTFFTSDALPENGFISGPCKEECVQLFAKSNMRPRTPWVRVSGNLNASQSVRVAETKRKTRDAGHFGICNRSLSDSRGRVSLMLPLSSKQEHTRIAHCPFLGLVSR